MLSLLALVVVLLSINKTEGLLNDTHVDPSISWFLKYTPFFDLTQVPQISEKCRSDFKTFLTAMDNLELWALKSEKQ